MKVIIYARVSTSTQDYERQLYELRSYSKRMGYEVVKEFSEKISGAKKVEELRLLRKGYSLANVRKLTGTAVNTLRKVSKIGGITESRKKRMEMEFSI